MRLNRHLEKKVTTVKKIATALAGVLATATLTAGGLAVSAAPAAASHNCVTASEYFRAVNQFRNHNPGPGKIYSIFDFSGYVWNSFTSRSGYDEIRHYRKCPSFDGGGTVEVWYDTYTYSNGRLSVYSIDRYAFA